MPADMNYWKKVVKQSVASIADEAMQRRAWFGIGPEVSSPTEEYCGLFDDAAIKEYLSRSDTGVTPTQRKAGQNLIDLMDKLKQDKPDLFRDLGLIDDPRWAKIREAAKQFLAVL